MAPLKKATQPSLRLTEIFYSLQGETDRVGLPTVFIRLTGCPLRCGYCDTAYAFYGGTKWAIADILSEVAQFTPRYVTVTGGEPLAQHNCRLLLVQLCQAQYRVSLETSGAIPLDNIDARVVIVMDIKTPASGESARNCYENIEKLREHDRIKFVLSNQHDYEWAKKQMHHFHLTERVSEILLSPVHQVLSPTALAEWILHDRLPVRMQLPLHKQLWGETPGR